MTTNNTGGHAFPQEIGWCSPNQTVQYRGPQGGMTLRDYFAAKAMQALITSRHTDYENGWYEEAMVAASAFDMADAMLKARSA